MRIKDVIKGGLFESINYQIDNFTFNELDFLFLTKFGEREITPTLEALLDENNEITKPNLDLLGQIINKMFSHSWDSQNTILTHEFTPFDNYYETITTNRDISNESNSNTDINTYAFDSLESVDKDNTLQTNTGNTLETITQTKKGLQGASYNDMIEQALKIKALKLVDIVFNDIKWFISLDIYK